MGKRQFKLDFHEKHFCEYCHERMLYLDSNRQRLCITLEINPSFRFWLHSSRDGIQQQQLKKEGDWILLQQQFFVYAFGNYHSYVVSGNTCWEPIISNGFHHPQTVILKYCRLAYTYIFLLASSPYLDSITAHAHNAVV